MYAVQDAGMSATPLPPAGFNGPQPGQVEPRAVESTEEGALESEGRDELIYSHGSPVVQLVEDSAKGYSELVETVDRLDEAASSQGAFLGDGLGERVDQYA